MSNDEERLLEKDSDVETVRKYLPIPHWTGMFLALSLIVLLSTKLLGEGLSFPWWVVFVPVILWFVVFLLSMVTYVSKVKPDIDKQKTQE